MNDNATHEHHVDVEALQRDLDINRVMAENSPSTFCSPIRT